VSGEELAVDLVELGKVVHRLEVDVDLDDVLEVASDRSEHLQRGPLSEKKTQHSGRTFCMFAKIWSTCSSNAAGMTPAASWPTRPLRYASLPSTTAACAENGKENHTKISPADCPPAAVIVTVGELGRCIGRAVDELDRRHWCENSGEKSSLHFVELAAHSLRAFLC